MHCLINCGACHIFEQAERSVFIDRDACATFFQQGLWKKWSAKIPKMVSRSDRFRLTIFNVFGMIEVLIPGVLRGYFFSVYSEFLFSSFFVFSR